MGTILLLSAHVFSKKKIKFKRENDFLREDDIFFFVVLRMRREKQEISLSLIIRCGFSYSYFKGKIYFEVHVFLLFFIFRHCIFILRHYILVFLFSYIFRPSALKLP